ncbi:MAG: BadF/BadG/BcrA/BcrD ATPase family protein [Pirellulales bacterium]
MHPADNERGLPPTYVLGVDGGGTKTAAWIARIVAGQSPSIVGKGRAGPGNPRAAGFEFAQQNILTALQAAWVDADLAPQNIAAACLALAGAGRAEEQERMRDWAIAQKIATHVIVTHDAEPLLAAAQPEDAPGLNAPWGIALIAGTGSLAWGRAVDGRVGRCGGWGYLVGDEGSGYAVGIAALRAILQAADGRGPATSLASPLLDFFQACESTELVGILYGDPAFRGRIAAASRIVLQVAREHDVVACGIISQAVEELAAMVAALAKRLELADNAYPLALGGGVFDAAGELAPRLVEQLALHQLAPRTYTIVTHPVLGAVRLAQRQLDIRQ